MAAIGGIDFLSNVDSYVNRFLAVERRPFNALKSRKSELQKKIGIYGDLKTELLNLRKRVRVFSAFGAESVLGARQAFSSNETVVKATADGDAETGVNTIFVSRIAGRDTALTDRLSLKGKELATRFFKTTQQFSLRVGGDAATISIAFTDKKETNASVLKRIAEQINGSGLNVSANAIDVSRKSGRLAVVSGESGSEHEVTFAALPGSSLLERIGLPGAGGRTEATTTNGGYLKTSVDELDALFTLNGVEITTGSNTITDVVEGLTINLLKAQKETDQPETITVSADGERLQQEIKGFIDDYNRVLNFINAKTRTDGVTGERGALSENFGVRRLQLKLRETLVTNFPGENENDIVNITSLGISIARDGTLSIKDDDLFEKNLADNPEQVRALFTGDKGIAVVFDKVLTEFTRFGGAISDAEKGTRDRIQNIELQSKRVSERLKRRESSLQQQFSQLQRLLSSLTVQRQTLQQVTSLSSTGFFGFSTPRTFGFV